MASTEEMARDGSDGAGGAGSAAAGAEADSHLCVETKGTVVPCQEIVEREASDAVGRVVESPPRSEEEISHLVQDDDLIARIHLEELPPDEYYDDLGAVLAKSFPGADPALVEHIVPLVAAFDTATGFALSFGIAKFQLAQKEVHCHRERKRREWATLADAAALCKARE